MTTSEPLNIAFIEFLSTVPVTRLKQNLMNVFVIFIKHHHGDSFPDFMDDFLTDFEVLINFLYRIEEAIEAATEKSPNA
jgi:hypothetical protein